MQWVTKQMTSEDFITVDKHDHYLLAFVAINVADGIKPTARYQPCQLECSLF